MHISPLYPRIAPIPPLLIISPPPPEKKPDEPISFCGHLSRLLEIHRRHTMMERMMLWMSKVNVLLGFSTAETSGKLNRLI